MLKVLGKFSISALGAQILRPINISSIYPHQPSNMLDSIKQRIKIMLKSTRSRIKSISKQEETPQSSPSTPAIPPQSKDDSDQTINGDAEIEIIDLYDALTIRRKETRAGQESHPKGKGVVAGREFVIVKSQGPGVIVGREFVIDSKKGKKGEKHQRSR
jgi:hypothetical protein